MSKSTAVLTAFYGAMKNASTLRTQLEAGRGGSLGNPLPVYLLQAPPDEPLPCVTFNEVSRTPLDTSDSLGGDHLIDVHVYSRAGSPKEAYDILGAIEDIFSDPSITVTGYTLLHCRPASIRCDVDQDGTYHGVASFRVLTSS